MNKFEKILAIIVVVLAIIAATIAALSLLWGPRPQNPATANSFIGEPVVDIIIPSLFRTTSTGGINAPLNASGGQSLALTIQLFPTTNLNVSMQFRYFVLGGLADNSSSSGTQNFSSSQFLSAKFNPPALSIIAGKTANTTMQLTITKNAIQGKYNSVVSAVNMQNSSQIWGVIIPINLD